MQNLYEKHNDDLRLPLVWQSRDVACLPHFHACCELVYVRSGTMTGVINGAPVTVPAGSMSIVGSYDIHAYDHRDLDAIVAVIPMTVVPALRKSLSSGMFATRVLPDPDGIVKPLLSFLLAHPTNEHVAFGICEALLGFLIEKVGLNETDRKDNTHLLTKLLTYIEEHFAEPLTVETLAEVFGYSRSRFSHLFKSGLGYSLPRYLNSLRAQHAAQLLRTTDMTVTAIAEECGFANARSFYNAFEAEYGMTPSKYLASRNTPRSAADSSVL